MDSWREFPGWILSSPRRTAYTLIGLFLLLCLVVPGFLSLVFRTVIAPILVLVLICAVIFNFFIKPFMPSGKKNKS